MRLDVPVMAGSMPDAHEPPSYPECSFTPMDDDGEIWLSTRDAAEYLGVPLRTLYLLIDEGRLSAYKLGRNIKLKAAEVEAFLAPHGRPAETDSTLMVEPQPTLHAVTSWRGG